jgi:hypothetical protein
MAKPFAWSYSSLELFELCPKKFYHTKIKRDVVEEFGPEAQYGTEVHKHFENRLIKGKKLPLDLFHHEKIMAKLAAAPGEGMPEQKLALNRDMEPTGFFDSDVWLRGVVDFAKKNNNNLLIIDHKTGRQKEGFDQVILMGLMMAAYMPEIDNFIVGYYWTKTKCITSTKFTKEDIPTLWAGFLEREAELQQSIRHDEFPAKANFLCKRYCVVKSCPNCGG